MAVTARLRDSKPDSANILLFRTEDRAKQYSSPRLVQYTYDGPDEESDEEFAFTSIAFSHDSNRLAAGMHVVVVLVCLRVCVFAYLRIGLCNLPPFS